MEFIAHRGESYDAPENTLAAFNLAWDRGDKAIELDVYLTRDSGLICCHDDTTDKTTGVPGKVADRTVAELKQLDAGRWKAERWTGERMPTLGEALATVPDGARCFIELKGDPGDAPGPLVDALKTVVEESALRREQLVVICFNPEAIAETKRKMPWMTAYLLGAFWGELGKLPAKEGVRRLIDAARLCRADGLNLDFSGPLDKDYIRMVKDAGLGFYVWTVDDVESAARMIEIGVDGIASNRAAWLKAQLGL